MTAYEEAKAVLIAAGEEEGIPTDTFFKMAEAVVGPLWNWAIKWPVQEEERDLLCMTIAARLEGAYLSGKADARRLEIR